MRVPGMPDMCIWRGHRRGARRIMMIVSPVFQGLSRVARSRAVHEALAEEFATGLHALSLKLSTPAEVAAV